MNSKPTTLFGFKNIFPTNPMDLNFTINLTLEEIALNFNYQLSHHNRHFQEIHEENRNHIQQQVKKNHYTLQANIPMFPRKQLTREKKNKWFPISLQVGIHFYQKTNVATKDTFYENVFTSANLNRRYKQLACNIPIFLK